MEIENQLQQIAKSYDRHFVEYGKKDALTYDNLPQYIVKHPDYKHYKNEQQSDWEANRRKQLIEFLSPAKKHEVYSTWLLC